MLDGLVGHLQSGAAARNAGQADCASAAILWRTLPLHRALQQPVVQGQWLTAGLLSLVLQFSILWSKVANSLQHKLQLPVSCADCRPHS